MRGCRWKKRCIVKRTNRESFDCCLNGGDVFFLVLHLKIHIWLTFIPFLLTTRATKCSFIIWKSIYIQPCMLCIRSVLSVGPVWQRRNHWHQRTTKPWEIVIALKVCGTIGGLCRLDPAPLQLHDYFRNGLQSERAGSSLDYACGLGLHLQWNKLRRKTIRVRDWKGLCLCKKEHT